MTKHDITAHSRGHKIYWNPDTRRWYYSDNDELYDNKNDRACKKCGCYPTLEGYDACLGYLENVSHACCGHGVSEAYMKE